MRKNMITRTLASVAIGAGLAGGLLAAPASAQPVFTDQVHMRDNCERAGGRWERIYHADGRLAGYRCKFKNGDEIICRKDWTNPDNCVYVEEKPGGYSTLTSPGSYYYGPTTASR